MGYWLQRISIILVAVAGIILAPLACMFMLQGDYIWVGAALGFLALFLFLSQDVRKQWMYIVCALSVGGTLNFLPLNFSVSELSILMVFAHFFLSEVIFKKRGIIFGDQWMVMAISLIGVIVLFHWFKEGIGLRVLGGGSVGARKSISMILGIVAYFVVITLCQDQWKLLNKLPFIYVIVTVVSSVPFILTTFFPGLGPLIYVFYGDINATAYLDMIAGEDSIGRVGKYGAIATAVQLALICYYPVKDWWRPNRWWVAIVWVIGLYLCMSSGYRNSIFGYGLIFLIGSFVSSKLKAVFLWLFGGVVFALIVVGQGNFFDLPLKVQRTLSFLPGNWDYEVKMDAASSDDFRKQIKDIYLAEFADKSPWIGSGFNYDASEVTGQMTFEKKWEQDSYSMFKGFIIRKDFHIGWISLYDTIGVVGGICFVVIFLSGSRYLVLMVQGSGNSAPPPIVTWLVISWVPTFINFFAVFGAIQQTFPVMCIYGALIWCCYQAWKEEMKKEGIDVESKDPSKKLSPVSEEVIVASLSK